MFKLYFADKDTYITDKIINGVRKVSSSVGHAGTLDLFKIYSVENSGSIELSRLLVHYDITDLKKLYDANLIDITHPSFNCVMNLRDVYGGQPTPAEFNVSAYPMSQSFSEGFGKDIVYLLDYDSANFLSSSANKPWNVEEAGAGGHVTSSSGIDYITDASFGSTKTTQFFKTGEEDLKINVTNVISATLAGEIPDAGFRISFDAEEGDNLTYFIKRFASRHAYNSTLQPTLTVGFDDSIIDESARMKFSSSGSLFVYNYENDEPRNFLSGSSQLTGTNCIKLTLNNSNYLGQVNLSFTGSQFSHGTHSVSGTYYAGVHIPLTNEIRAHLTKSGSVSFTPIWTSIDDSVVYLTGSSIKFFPTTTYSSPELQKRLTVNVLGTPDKMSRLERSRVRVNVFDISDPLINVVKFSTETPGKVFSRSYYQIRDIDSDQIVVPYDVEKNSTRLSADEHGMFFFLDGGSLFPGRTYIIDIMILIGNDRYTYNKVSAPFTVV